LAPEFTKKVSMMQLTKDLGHWHAERGITRRLLPGYVWVFCGMIVAIHIPNLFDVCRTFVQTCPSLSGVATGSVEYF